jgi:hypothetical protein
MTICAQILEFPDWRVFRRRLQRHRKWEEKSRNEALKTANVHSLSPKARFRRRDRNRE